jgi:hypothetical protein
MKSITFYNILHFILYLSFLVHLLQEYITNLFYLIGYSIKRFQPKNQELILIKSVDKKPQKKLLFLLTRIDFLLQP